MAAEVACRAGGLGQEVVVGKLPFHVGMLSARMAFFGADMLAGAEID